MKTISLSDETHKNLTIKKAELGTKTLTATVAEILKKDAELKG